MELYEEENLLLNKIKFGKKIFSEILKKRE